MVGWVDITFSEDDKANYYKGYRSHTPGGTYAFLGDSATMDDQQ